MNISDEYHKIITSYAHKFSGRADLYCMEQEDAFQEAWMAGMKALEYFDDSKGNSFSTVAYKYMHQRMLNLRTRTKRRMCASIQEIMGENDDEFINRFKDNRTPHSDAVKKEEFDLVKDVIRSLNLNDRDNKIFNNMVQGCTAEEVSISTRLTRQRVHQIYSKIVNQIRNTINNKLVRA